MGTTTLPHQHDSPTVLIATDACRRAGHELAVPEQAPDAGAVLCVTCTETWGNMQGLRDWQQHCPCCFSAAHPHGLADLGISAQTSSSAELRQPAALAG